MNADCDTCVTSRGRGQLGIRPATLILIGLGLFFGSPDGAWSQPELEGQSRPQVDAAAGGSAEQALKGPVDRRNTDQRRVERSRIAEPQADSNPRIPADRVDQAMDHPADQAVDQINAIRRQMGGGVAAQLEGLFENSDRGRQQLQHEFDRHLNNLMGASTAPPVPAVQSHLPSGSARSVCVTLRQAARKLDSVAADLEDIELYAESDQIRGNARNLRLRARMMAPSRTANAVLPGGSTWQQSPRYPRPASTSDESGLPMNPSGPKIRPRQ